MVRRYSAASLMLIHGDLAASVTSSAALTAASSATTSTRLSGRMVSTLIGPGEMFGSAATPNPRVVA